MTQFRGNAATTIAEVCAYAAALYRRIRELLRHEAGLGEHGQCGTRTIAVLRDNAGAGSVP